MEYLAYCITPLGNVQIVAGNKGISSIKFTDAIAVNSAEESKGQPDFLWQCKEQIEQYFAGTLRSFTLPLELNGTSFQMQVWQHLLGIEFGKQNTYGQIAKLLFTRQAARAVGRACGTNPVWLVVPCHRVLGSMGNLTGYGGGLHRKQWLLDFEQAELKGKQTTLF